MNSENQPNTLNPGDAYVLLTQRQRNFLTSLLHNLFKEPNVVVDTILESIETANDQALK